MSLVEDHPYRHMQLLLLKMRNLSTLNVFVKRTVEQKEGVNGASPEERATATRLENLTIANQMMFRFGRLEFKDAA